MGESKFPIRTLLNATVQTGNVSEWFNNGTSQDFVLGCGDHSFEHPDFTQIKSVSVTIIIAYLLVMIFAVFGNILVIWTIWTNTHMHTVTNYYIINLAISDFLVSAIVLPLKLLEFSTPCTWQIFSNDGLCSILNFLEPIFVFASVFTLVAISLERYYAIVHPLSAMKVNSKSRTKKIIAATWVIPVIVASPFLYAESYSFSVHHREFGQISRQICTDRFNELDNNTGIFRKVYFLVLSALMYFLPMTIIITTCTIIARCLLRPIIIESSQEDRRNSKRRDEVNKRKVARMVIVIAVAFIMSWSPQYIVSVVSQLQTVSFLTKGNFVFTMLMTHLCGFINSCVNPFIYTAMSKKFRKSFGRTLGRLFCNYYCRQRLFQYRGSVSARRSTAYTSASHGSFLEPEVEPLHNELKPKSNTTRGRESYSSSSDGGSSCRSQTRLCRSSRGGSKNQEQHLLQQQEEIFDQQDDYQFNNEASDKSHSFNETNDTDLSSEKHSQACELMGHSPNTTGNIQESKNTKTVKCTRFLEAENGIKLDTLILKDIVNVKLKGDLDDKQYRKLINSLGNTDKDDKPTSKEMQPETCR